MTRIVEIYRRVLDNSYVSLDEMDRDWTASFSSLQIVEIIVELESTFNIDFDIEDLELSNFCTLHKTYDMIKKYNNLFELYGVDILLGNKDKSRIIELLDEYFKNSILR